MFAAILGSMMIGSALTPLPALKVSGKHLVDPNGQVVTLKGANLGHWLVMEFWMFGFPSLDGMPHDQYQLEELLTRRFGESQSDRLMNLYRDSWITERDFQNLQKFGFNLVRLPMNYRLMEDDRKPKQLKPDAWKTIDRAINWAEKYGMYVLLDMHGAQGGQSPFDHTGRANQNKLKDSPDDQERLAWLWTEIAKRYRNRSAVMGYDPFNEPYGMPKDVQVTVFQRVYDAVRAVDPDKLMYAPGNWDNFDHYGDPKDHGWKNVGFQMHYYPGMFGWGFQNKRTQKQHFDNLPAVAKKLDAMNVPFIVGEFNVVADSAGGADMMRRHFDTYASYGWSSTMWAYKAYNPEGGVQSQIWGAVVNRHPSRRIDFKTASLEQVETFMKGFATDELVVHEKLVKALTQPGYRPEPWGEVFVPRLEAPQDSWPNWEQVDVGSPMRGGLKRLQDDRFELYGGGVDIWAKEDQFRYLHQLVSGDFEAEVVVESVEEIDHYTKSGIMARLSLDKDAPFALISLFPTAEVQFASRLAAGVDATADPNAQSKLPGVRVKLVRRGNRFEGSYQLADGTWKLVGACELKAPRDIYVGAVALSHSPGELAKIVYRDLVLRK